MEVINSFFSNIKDKLTNPFFGTLILVLILHHWELWYVVFNFDEAYSLSQKLNFIEIYIAINLTFYSFLWDVAQAFLYMILGYLIVVLTRSLVLWVEFGLMPFITGKIVNKNVVRKNKYDDVVREREEYFDQYEEQRENVRNFSKTIDKQTEQIKLKDKDLLKQSETISITVRELDVTNIKLDKTQKEIQEKSSHLDQLKNSITQLQEDFDNQLKRLKKFQNLFLGDENKEFYSSIDKFPPEVLKKVHELKKDDEWHAFLAVGKFYQNGGTIGGEVVTEMINRELAFDRDNREELTPVGQLIWNFREIFDKEDEYKIF